MELRAEAERYCALIEEATSYGREKFVARAWTSLVGVLASAVRQPGGTVGPDLRGPDQVERHQRLSDLQAVLGDCDPYWSTADAYGDDAEEALTRVLADDLADIWLELKTGLLALEDGVATLPEVSWDWGSGLTSHWGRHAVEAIRALHELMSMCGWPDPPAQQDSS